MLIKLKTNKNKVDDYNKRIRECREKYPDFSFNEVEGVESVFYPYYEFKNDSGWSKYSILQADTRNDSEFTGIYVTHLNGNHNIEDLTDWMETTDSNYPIYWCTYGVADNGSQVLEYYEKLVQKNPEYMNNNDFVILMTPIFREDQSEHDGWRWHKWGRYIGVFDIKHEYLFDEQGIDYVYVFDIVRVEKDA